MQLRATVDGEQARADGCQVVAAGAFFNPRALVCVLVTHHAEVGFQNGVDLVFPAGAGLLAHV
jgi:hypothetical protein